MSEFLQVKILASGRGGIRNEADTNAFLASMDPSRIVEVMSGVGTKGEAEEFKAEPCCVVLYKAKAEELDAKVEHKACTEYGGVFGSEE